MSSTIAENGAIQLAIGQGGGNGPVVVLDTWKSYSFNSHFLTPTDGWSFTLGDEEVTDDLRIAIAPRQKVTLSINGSVVGSGIVDKVTTKASRHGGTEITIDGRDVFSPLVDSGIDPRLQFKESQSLFDVLSDVFGPFGFPPESLLDYTATGTDNDPILSSFNHGIKTSKKGKLSKDWKLHQLKPNAHESAMGFAHRISQRFGLWLWPSTDGAHVMIGTPSFDQEPAVRLVHKKGADGVRNNILSSSLVQNGGAQPSIIFASGFTTGGENALDNFTICVVNPFIQTNLSKILAAYPKTVPLDLSYLGPKFSGTGVTTSDAARADDQSLRNSTGIGFVDTNARPLFLHDEEAKDIDQLTAFLKRELASRMHKAFVYQCEVEGHESLDKDGNKTPWKVGMTVAVDDDIANVQQTLWVLSRTFTKSRTGGTKTQLELIVPHTLEF